MSKSRNNHGLRTTGTHTGNFGRAKVQGKRESLDISPQILQRENLSIPSREEAFAKLRIAYEAATDPKVRATLAEMLRARQATLRQPAVKKTVCSSPYWEEVKRVR
jgi:hypothetical protein